MCTPLRCSKLRYASVCRALQLTFEEGIAKELYNILRLALAFWKNCKRIFIGSLTEFGPKSDLTNAHDPVARPPNLSAQVLRARFKAILRIRSPSNAETSVCIWSLDWAVRIAPAFARLTSLAACLQKRLYMGSSIYSVFFFQATRYVPYVFNCNFEVNQHAWSKLSKFVNRENILAFPSRKSKSPKD